MAKRSTKKKTIRRDVLPYADVGLPLLLALVTFAVYWPSLKSGFVYDARIAIISEGFVSSLANLPDVLSFKVLNSHLIMGGRPGQLLYLMLNAAVWGKEPWGYHLVSNLLHAANAALLFVFLRRLVAADRPGLAGKEALGVQLAMVVATLIFALHPVATEAVSGLSYSSDLLITFFTLLALLAATAFRPDDPRAALRIGGAGTLCAFAAVTCKESGLAASLLMVVYWFLFRRQEAKRPWLIFLGSALAATAGFLAARFYFAPVNLNPPPYLGGSLAHVFFIQPKFWVFMMGKLLVPLQLSADYTVENADGISLPLALVILVLIVSLQVWLAAKNRIGALGVATFWLGLATVSNVIPLYEILADRFYYLPMAGVAMQLLALFLMTLGSRIGLGAVVVAFVALLPLTVLTVFRENVFVSDPSLWMDTMKASPHSWMAHYNLGADLSEERRTDQAMVEFQKALEINPQCVEAITDMGAIHLKRKQFDQAIPLFQEALKIKPNLPETLNDLGIAFSQKGRVDEAITCYRKAVAANSDYAVVRFNLGMALLQQGKLDEAIAEFQAMLVLQPDYADAHTELGIVFSQQGKLEDAVAQFREVVRLRPNDADAQHNLSVEEAMAEKTGASK